MTSPTTSAMTGPGLLDALSLLAEVADELVVQTARDTHTAVTDRVGVLTRPLGVAGGLPDALHRGIAGAVYGGIGLGLRAAARGLDRAAQLELEPRVEETAAGRRLNATVNGLIGDRLLRERPQLAIPMAVRAHGRDVEPDTDGLAAAFPLAGGDVVVFLHGLFEDETFWRRHRDRVGTTYGEALDEAGWTPVFLRANSGLPVRENGVALAALLQRVVDGWPVPVTRIALVGHSMGGLIMRAAGAVVDEVEHDPTPDSATTVDGRVVPTGWSGLVSDVVTLGTPHHGSPVAWGVGHGSRGLGLLPETAAFGRILDQRSRGVTDLVRGLGGELDGGVAPLPGVRYHLVAATLSTSARHPIGNLVGDLLVRPASAHGRDRRGRELFPGADVLHVGGTDHFGLLNHPDVLDALLEWLA